MEHLKKKIVKPSEDASSDTIKIASVPENKRSKRIPLKHTTRMIWTKELKQKWKSSQEDWRMDNKKFHRLEPK